MVTGVIESYVFPLRVSDVLPLRTGSGIGTYGADSKFKMDGYTFRVVLRTFPVAVILGPIRRENCRE